MRWCATIRPGQRGVTALDGLHRYFPFRTVGYQCNPFRALTVDEEATLAVLPPQVLDAYTQSSTHLQIMGEKGRGKSATLHGLAARAEESGLRVAYEYLPEGQKRFLTDLHGLDLFVLDEAQRLSRSERARLLESPPHLIVSSHADLSADFRRHHLPLRSIRLGNLGPGHVRAVLDGRLDHFALGDRPRAALSEDAYAWLTATFGDDLRSTITLLYEAFQSLDGPSTVDAARLAGVAAQT
jgi:hypothetical protein